MTPTIINANCLDALRNMPDNSVDAVITDPPYGLSNTTPDKVADTIVRWASGDREHVPAGRGFMGAEWDSFVPPPAVWDECFRVLKPGGHLAVFAGSRTQDLMGISVRLAGFDVRDSLAWLHGSGFPKSLDVSKAIDKLNGRKYEDRYALGRHIRERRELLGLTRAEVNRWLESVKKCEHYESQNSTDARVPTLADWVILQPRLGLSDEHRELVERAEAEREVIGKSAHKSGIGNATVGHYTVGGTKAEAYDITAPATDEARRWEGWGTALKPAHEPILLARKPLQGTVAANVTTWGTGAINVDACRISLGDEKPPTGSGKHSEFLAQGGGGFGTKQGGNATPATGRFPANVVLDEHAAHELDQQSGTSKSKSALMGKRTGIYPLDGFHTVEELKAAAERGEKTPKGRDARATLARWEAEEPTVRGHDDEGGASRFFYVAKAPKRERPNVDGVQHPTVKPLALMRWLVRLLTPPGGVVLDPFAGSGTTVEAALLEGFRPVGIEAHEPYIALIQQRIERATAA